MQINPASLLLAALYLNLNIHSTIVLYLPKLEGGLYNAVTDFKIKD